MALQLRSALTARGAPCWIAPEDIPYGSNFPAEIQRALEKCSILILLASPPVNDSEYIHDEVCHAYEAKAKRYRVNLMKGVELDPELSFWLKRSQWIDAHAMPPEEWQEKLVASVLEDLGEGSSEGSGEKGPAVLPARHKQLLTRQEILNGELSLRAEKLRRLRLSLATESDVSSSFKLERQILEEEAKIDGLGSELREIERRLGDS